MNKRARRNKLNRARHRKVEKAVKEDRGVKRGLWIAGIATSFPEWKGLLAEEKALEALNYFRKKKVKFYDAGIITGLSPTMHFDEKDKCGIDIVANFENDTLLIQVKVQGSQELEKKLRDRNKCLIAIPWDAPEKKAREIVQGAVNHFLRTKKETD